MISLPLLFFFFFPYLCPLPQIRGAALWWERNAKARKNNQIDLRKADPFQNFSYELDKKSEALGLI